MDEFLLLNMLIRIM